MYIIDSIFGPKGNEAQMIKSNDINHKEEGGEQGGGGGGGGGGQAPPNNLSAGGGGGATYPFPHLFLQFLCETGKNHNCTKLKGKMVINVTLI